MKWYDYAICFLIADFISAGIMTGSFLVIGVGIFNYYSYEDWRKGG
jgi:hypothetical protein